MIDIYSFVKIDFKKLIIDFKKILINRKCVHLSKIQKLLYFETYF